MAVPDRDEMELHREVQAVNAVVARLVVLAGALALSLPLTSLLWPR